MRISPGLVPSYLIHTHILFPALQFYRMIIARILPYTPAGFLVPMPEFDSDTHYDIHLFTTSPSFSLFYSTLVLSMFQYSCA